MKNKTVGASNARSHIEESAKRKNNGITLIALIITIIVMLILVAVSISIALNTGLFESAGKATGDWKTAQDEEEKLGNGKVNVGGTVYDNIDEYIATIGGENTGGGATVVAGGRASKNSTYTDASGKKAVIPAKFTVSGVPSESTIDGGLVIYLIPEGTTIDWTDGTAVANAQKTYDQFVWIPIKNTTDSNAQDINDMYICQGKTSSNGTCEIKVENGVAKCTNANHSSIVEGTEINKNTLMAGRLYATSTGEKFEQAYTEVYTSGSGLREPDTVSSRDGDSTYLGYLTSILGTTGYDTEADFKESLQKEYNEVVKSVYENQGFYCRKI